MEWIDDEIKETGSKVKFQKSIKAIRMGNSAAVYLPKEYENRQVTIYLPEKLEDIKQRVLSLLLNQ